MKDTLSQLDVIRIVSRVLDLQKTRVTDITLSPERHGLSREMFMTDPKNFATAVDGAVEKLLREELVALLPGSQFLGEETGSTGEGSTYRWIVDPIDGTSLYSLGGDYWSNSIGLIALDSNVGSKIIIGSVYQPRRSRLFLTMGLDFNRVYHIPGDSRDPIRTDTRAFPEFLGVSFGTSKHYEANPGVKERLARVFGKTMDPINKREYGAIDARPGSGSSALFCCDIADGNRHFAMLFYQKPWDLAVGAVFAQRAGCPTVMFDNSGNVIDADLETVIARSGPKDLINVGVFANEHVKEYVLGKFNG